MDTPNIAVIESQKRSNQVEFLRWSKVLEDTRTDLDDSPVDDPRSVYLRSLYTECQLMSDHYRSIGDQQEKTLSTLRGNQS